MEDIEVRPLVGLLEGDSGTRLSLSEQGTHTTHVVASADHGRPGVRIEVDLADAVAYWQPGGRGSRPLPPDWSEPSVTSLVESAPIGALYNAGGEVLLSWAAAEPIHALSVRYGVSEERKSFVVDIRPLLPLDHSLVLLVRSRAGRLAQVVRELAAWVSEKCVGTALKTPAITRAPVYSTWYTFNQDIDHQKVMSEAELAVPLGFGSTFIDDGWQRLGHARGYQGCGDWLPDHRKFPDLAGTVASLHDHGLAVALWVAPLLLGAESRAFEALRRFAPREEETLNCWVLDPRLPQVREHVISTCLRLVCDYGADLLKIDFLDQAMIYRDEAGEGDIDDVGQAMARMLSALRSRLDAAGRSDVAFEFRQPYVSPAIARYGEILRANDCPGDSLANRASILDARLVAAGQVVHSDPMMWGTTGGADAVAQQMYAGWFAVPQVSMRINDLPREQREALRGLLALWRELSDVALDGTLDLAGAERGYDIVRSVHSDTDRTVIARYAPIVVEIDADATRTVTLLNGTPTTGLVLRLRRRRLLSGVVRSAAGAHVATIASAEAGLVDLDVPAFGSITIETQPA